MKLSRDLSYKSQGIASYSQEMLNNGLDGWIKKSQAHFSLLSAAGNRFIRKSGVKFDAAAVFLESLNSEVVGERKNSLCSCCQESVVKNACYTFEHVNIIDPHDCSGVCLFVLCSQWIHNNIQLQKSKHETFQVKNAT